MAKYKWNCGASMRELYGTLAFRIHYLFPLMYISCNNSPIPRSPPTVAPTTGGECQGKRVYGISIVCRCLRGNVTWVLANLGFILHMNICLAYNIGNRVLSAMGYGVGVV